MINLKIFIFKVKFVQTVFNTIPDPLTPNNSYIKKLNSKHVRLRIRNDTTVKKKYMKI